MKKRNCRRSDRERIIHEKAVALRKMTDEQLVNALEEQHVKGYDTGYKNGIADSNYNDNALSPQKIIERLSTIKGFGESTIAKIRMVLQEVE